VDHVIVSEFRGHVERKPVKALWPVGPSQAVGILRQSW
jgi:hypothetical protein